MCTKRKKWSYRLQKTLWFWNNTCTHTQMYLNDCVVTLKYMYVYLIYTYTTIYIVLLYLKSQPYIVTLLYFGCVLLKNTCISMFFCFPAGPTLGECKVTSWCHATNKTSVELPLMQATHWSRCSVTRKDLCVTSYLPSSSVYTYKH